MFRSFTYVVLAPPFHISPIFMFVLDSYYREQLCVSHAPGMTWIEKLKVFNLG